MTRWGKAGVRLSEQEMVAHGRAATARRNRHQLKRGADDRVAYRLWRAGEVKPWAITLALDARGLYGTEVDQACGATEPDVDLWEAGKLYPTWAQTLLLADLCGVTPRLLCQRPEPLPARATSMRFHGYVDETPLVRAFLPEAVALTVAGAPPEMPTTTAKETR